MAREWKLIVPVIHGMGDQDPKRLGHFASCVKVKTREHLEHLGNSAALVDNHLLVAPLDWSSAYKSQSDNWLKLFFRYRYIKDLPHSQGSIADYFRWIQERAASSISRIILLVSSLILIMLVTTTLTLVIGWDSPVVKSVAIVLTSLWLLGWLVSIFIMVTGIGPKFIWMKLVGKNFNWGRSYNLGRSFEANYLSDIVMYLSEEPRQAIINLVLEELETHAVSSLRDISSLYGPGGSSVYTVFIGHSLGSVITYDLYRAHRKYHAEGTAGEGTTELELARLGNSTHRNAAQYFLDNMNPLGMLTMGSPITLFLFRKPDYAGGKIDFPWRPIAPYIFNDELAYTVNGAEFHWHWTNFWHPTDGAAHRCSPYFSRNLPEGKEFVVDHRTGGRYVHLAEAHSSYFGYDNFDPRCGEEVIDATAQYLAGLMVKLEAAYQ